MLIQGTRKFHKGTIDGRLIEKACIGDNDLFIHSYIDSGAESVINSTYGIDGPAIIQASDDYIDELFNAGETQLAQNCIDYINNTNPLSAYGCTGWHISVESSYWRLNTSKYNPSGYWGLYESTRTGVHNCFDILTIKIYGKVGQFNILIDSYAESNYDYTLASNLDPSSFDNSHYKVWTKGNQKPGTSVSNYTVVTYDIPDTNEHIIKVAYRKDSSDNSNDDRGYLLIPFSSGFIDITNLTS